MSLFKIHEQIDKSWTLFLDRDGVINVETVGSYVTSWDEFKFIDGVLPSIGTLSQSFGNVIIVTNQRGVGRGIMTIDALKDINTHLKAEVITAGGKIDKIYACTAVSDDDHNRKPNVGMALQAREDFPGVDFKRSVMVGNSISDMEFGKRLGMHTVFLTTKHEPFQLPHDMIDEQFPSLEAWTKTLNLKEMASHIA